MRSVMLATILALTRLSSMEVMTSYTQSSDAKAGAAAARAEELLKQARAALGGEAKLKAVRSLSASGSYRRLLQGREMSGEIEFDLLLPDKFMKTEVMSMMSATVTRTEAFNGQKAWTDSSSSGGGMVVFRQGPPGTSEAQIEAAARQRLHAEFARLLLVWMLASPASFPLEFTYAGEAKAEDDSADVLDVKGPDGFASRLFLDQQTHRPLMLSYRGLATRMVVNSFNAPAGHSAGRSKEEIERATKEAQAKAQAEAPKPEEVEIQWRFADYREVSGLYFPHQLSKATNGEVNEEWELKKFKLNPQLKPEKFDKK
jgi:hypothetical protein